jgi:phosphatidylglycerophosphate synthase
MTEVSTQIAQAPARPFGRRPWRGGFLLALALALGAHLVVMLWVLAIHDGLVIALSLTVAALGAATVGGLAQRHYPHAAFGACNTITLFRAGLALALAVPLMSGGAGGWAVAAVALVALALDGVDGWAARRFGHASRFGARFDMEVDSIFALILALHAMLAGVAPAAMVVLGGARYGFALAARLWPWLAAPLPDRFSRKVVCVVQLATLIAVQAPVLSDWFAAALAFGAAAVVLASFALDIRWLAARRCAG